MKVMQFAYGHDANNANLPHHFALNSVAYTGTHDNNTTRGWLEHLANPLRAQVDAYFQLRGSRSAWPMIRALLATTSRLAVVPLQALLDLGADAVLNRPGTTVGNWQWRFTDLQLARLAKTKTEILREWIQIYDRTGLRQIVDYSEPPQSP